MSPTSDITDVHKCPIGQYPLMSAVDGRQVGLLLLYY